MTTELEEGLKRRKENRVLVDRSSAERVCEHKPNREDTILQPLTLQLVLLRLRSRENPGPNRVTDLVVNAYVSIGSPVFHCFSSATGTDGRREKVFY